MPSAKTAKHANDVEIKNQKNIPKSTIPKIEAIKSRSNIVEAPIYFMYRKLEDIARKFKVFNE
jgi:hypothetical protein